MRTLAGEGEACGKEVGGGPERLYECCDIFGRKDLVSDHFTIKYTKEE